MKRVRRDGGPRSRRGRASRGAGGKAQKGEPAPASRRRPAFETLPSAKMPRFAGIASFLRLPVVEAAETMPAVDVLLVGLPFDAGTSFRAGARFGPRAV